MAGTDCVHLQGKWGRKAHSPGTPVLKDSPCAARCVINNSSNLLHFSCFYFSQLTGSRSPGLAGDEHFEIHLRQWELQREQLHSCSGWCWRETSFSASKILQWVTAADSLPAHNLAALGLTQMIGYSQCSCWAWQKVSAQLSWEK